MSSLLWSFPYSDLFILSPKFHIQSTNHLKIMYTCSSCSVQTRFSMCSLQLVQRTITITSIYFKIAYWFGKVSCAYVDFCPFFFFPCVCGSWVWGCCFFLLLYLSSTSVDVLCSCVINTCLFCLKNIKNTMWLHQ